MPTWSNDAAVSIRGLGKAYRIAHGAPQHSTLAEALVHRVRRPFRREEHETFWALRDVSAEIRRGEVVGIIGQNGAGKSTLLKILSRITEPTTGEVDLYGRVGSLLEVGTGFHRELTGRENIYLNGAILGMTRREIRRRFDEIVEFSGVEQFLDTPVKRYSSGMYVRLAFAVAAHLDPEILIVDEVLAVGDAEFQKKCLGKMNEVARAGRTVLFVSHNMGMIADLCGRCLRLAGGRIVADGSPEEVIAAYVSGECQQGRVDLTNWTVERSGDGPMQVLSLATTDLHGEHRTTFRYREPIVFRARIRGTRGMRCNVGISLRDRLGRMVLHLSNRDDKAHIVLPSDESELQVVLPDHPLNDSHYYVTVWLGDSRNVLHDRVGNCLEIEINSSMDGDIVALSPIRLPAEWETTAAEPIESILA